MAKPVILTGLRANNDLHIGNYFGALKPLIDMAIHHSDEYDIHLFVPDLHSFTTPIDHNNLLSQTLHNLKIFVAAGLPLDDKNIHIYRQSFIPAHSELTWILDCFTGYGQMARMTQFKDKSTNLSDGEVTVGLFNYPVLMAADILLYGASYVPVGDDQSQHLEFTRDIAERMNSRFGGLFTVPKPVKEQNKFFGSEQGLRIKDLSDPSKKMSKSDESGKGVIFLGESPESATKKIKSATTDSLGSIDINIPDQPGIRNLLQILALGKNQSYVEVAEQYQGSTTYGPLKSDVAETVSAFLSDFQKRLLDVDETVLMDKLQHDEIAMNKIAADTLYRVQKAVGLRP